MPQSQYVQLLIGGRSMDVPENDDNPVVINVEIEDDDSFQQKNGTTALDITIPATLNNSDVMNTFFNPASEDYSPENILRDVQSMSMTINGNEFMIGKAMIKFGRRINGKPLDMEVDLYSSNADWAIQNSELTLYDVINPTTHIFDVAGNGVDTSWYFDGFNENEFWVYAPARYRETFTGNGTDMETSQLRPALFLYWLLYAGFKAAGYRIKSGFMDSEYFRRLVLPWTWGSFLYIDSPELDIMKFRVGLDAYSTYSTGVNGSFSHYMSSGSDGFNMTNETTSGMFDNSSMVTWSGDSIDIEYLAPLHAQFGNIQFIIRFYANMTYDAVYATHTTVDLEWYVNGSLVTSVNVLSDTATAFQQILGANQIIDYTWLSPALTAGDIVSVKVLIGSWVGVTALASYAAVYFPIGGNGDMCFCEMVGFKIPVGGIVDFKKFPFLKNWKWMDILRGTIDAFNLQINSDSIGKTVTIEPSHEYSLSSDLVSGIRPGYYNGDFVDWDKKKDISKIETIENFSDYEQTFKISFQNDNDDGMMKLMADRFKTNLTESIYQFPTRFKKGIREMENRFFSGVMHYQHKPWQSITGIAPQLICLIPENISNSSNPSANNLFRPKLAYYKGLQSPDANVGGWSLNGDNSQPFPFMFAVNYFPGGEADPVLTYCDQKIDTRKGLGLFKRFFWTRFAIMRHGKRMTSSMYLENSDVMDSQQREFKMIDGLRWQCFKINGYRPLKNQSTECSFWLWFPVTSVDNDNTFPSDDSVMLGTPLSNSADPKYSQCMCLISDIPT